MPSPQKTPLPFWGGLVSIDNESQHFKGGIYENGIEGSSLLCPWGLPLDRTKTLEIIYHPGAERGNRQQRRIQLAAKGG
jgi:hypothetical protein